MPRMRRATPRLLPGMSSEAPADGGSFAWRTSLSAGLWLVAVALTYGASGMSWISSPDHDSRFPDPVWGEDLLHRGAAPGALVVFIGAAAMLVCWWLSGKVGTFGHANPRSRIRVATRVARILRLALILLLLLALLPSARGLALGWGEDWVGYPGWSRSLIAQLCALVAVLLLPRPDDPRRGAEAGYGRLRITVAGLLVLACLSLPLLPAALASASAETSGTTSTPASSTDPVSTSPESSRIRWAQVTLPLEGGDTGSTNSAASVAVGATWWHRWRGATAVRLIPTASGDSVAALVENSAPDRTALAVLGQATGATLTSWDVHALDGRGLSADPSSADHLRLFGDWLVHAGPLDEWRAQDGSFASSAPAPQELPGLTRLQMTGLHGRSTTSSAMWFLGDDNACQRRGALDGQGSWIHDRDTLVALELCTDTSPARAALLGIDPTSGDERWRVSVPGFDAWAAGLDGPVPTLSSSPWPVTFRSLPSSAPTDEGGTDEGEAAEGGADKGGPSVPTDPGTDAFEVVVDGVGHRIATLTGETLQTQG